MKSIFTKSKIGLRFVWCAASVLAVGTAAFPAQAASIFFGENQSPGGVVSGPPLTAHNNFLSFLIGVGTENFDSQPLGAIGGGGLALSFPGSSGSITATLTGPDLSINNTGNAGPGRFPTSGDQYLETSSNGFTVTFSSAVVAFGFYGTDIGDFSGQLTITTANGGSHLFNVANTIDGNDGSLLFWGIIDTANPFTSVTFGNTAAGIDFFGFDDMTVGDLQQVNPNPTPLPAALPLFAAGLGGLGLLGWRRKRRAAATAA
jgi:hypothetical protein